jgi:hypothetical protein
MGIRNGIGSFYYYLPTSKKPLYPLKSLTNRLTRSLEKEAEELEMKGLGSLEGLESLRLLSFS